MLILCAGVLPAHAQSMAAASRALTVARANAELPTDSPLDLEHGLDVVLGRAECSGEGDCLSCFQCHQIEGEGSVQAAIQRLTGQPYRYLYAALRDFASGRRQSGVMQPIARSLTDAAMRDVAAYYSAVRVGLPDMAEYAARIAEPDQQTLAAGGTLAAIGSAERGVQACVNCHGPQGSGLPPTYPYLAGQYADYLESTLLAFKNGERTSADYAAAAMIDVAARMSADDIHAVATYFASIQPPRILPERNYAAEAAAIAAEAPRGARREDRVAAILGLRGSRR